MNELLIKSGDVKMTYVKSTRTAASSSISQGYAFGKFIPGQTLPMREFETQLGIKGRNGLDAWESDVQSVQNLLDHLGRYTRSESSREKYLRNLLQFSRWAGLHPRDLVGLSKRRVEVVIQSFADELATKDRSKAYVNSVIKRLRTFFRASGYIGSKELLVHSYFVPTRYRKVPEYIPTKAEVFAMADAAGSRRDRAIILTLWSSGLRVSTFCSLNYGDLAEELEKDEPHIMIRVYPTMKERVPDACKGQIPYYTFVCPEAGEALRSNLKERREKYEKIDLDDPLFHSDWTLWAREIRSKRRLGRRAVGLIVKRAAKFAGIQQWKHVAPHCLRKAFETVLISPTIVDSRLDKATQEFFMGHILPGAQDVYYDKTKVDFHRREYAKLNFSMDRIPGKAVDKLVPLAELEKCLVEGWMFVAKIDDRKVIVRRKW